LQRPQKRTTVLAALAALAVAGVAGVALAGNPAQAEAPSPAPSASSSAAAGKPDRQADRAQRQDELAGALATELGIDKAKVAAALVKVQAERQKSATAERTAQLKTRLDEAVKAGKITAEQEAAILKAAEAGVLTHGGPGGPGGGGHGRHGGFGR
jgi:hypothetical protein